MRPAARTYLTATVLWHLQQRGTSNVPALAQASDYTEAEIRDTVQRMCVLGQVRRTGDPRPPKADVYTLTAVGLEAARRVAFWQVRQALKREVVSCSTC